MSAKHRHACYRLKAQHLFVVQGAERIQALASDLKAVAVPTDVTDRKQVKHLVDSAVETYGHVDVILNNAGVMPHSPLERLKVEDWEQMIDFSGQTEGRGAQVKR